MSITYAVLAAEVAGNIEIGASDYDRFKILTSINRAQDHILNTWDVRFLNDATKTVLLDLTADTVLYQYPADYLRWVQLWLNYTTEIPIGDPANIGKPARLIEDGDVIQNNRNTIGTTKYPTVSQGIEQGYEIRPMPAATVTHGRRLRYVYKLPEITDAQVCLFRSDKRNCLIYYATALSALVENYRPEIAKDMMALYNDEAKQYLPVTESRKKNE